MKGLKVGEPTGTACKNPACGKPLFVKWVGKFPLCCDRQCASQYSHTTRDAESYKKCAQTFVNKLTVKDVDTVEVPEWLSRSLM